MLIGIDQGTTGTACIAYEDTLHPAAHAYRKLPNYYPRPGRVEQDPEEIVGSVVATVGEVLESIGGAGKVQAVGLDNQGETIVAWDAVSGRAIGPAIVWSDGRGEHITSRLTDADLEERVRRITGLMLDPYFSAAKFAWLLENDGAVRKAADAGTLRLGTVDAWLAFRLGGGRHLTDHSTASRTQLMSLQGGNWDPWLLEIFGIEERWLPEIMQSLGQWGELSHPEWGGALPWRASLVDQPAALAGNGCFAPGQAKITYGTGCFVVANAGQQHSAPPEGVLLSVGWSRDKSRTHILDGGVFTAGTAINWLESVGLVESAEQTAELAWSADDAGGVRFLPAFTGLGAPWWDNNATGTFSGITGATTRAHLTRAVLDSIALRIRDVLDAMWPEGAKSLQALRVDGGLTKNDYLMQRQADLLGIPVDVSANHEATATGAAACAAIAAGLLSEKEVSDLTTDVSRFEPKLNVGAREEEYSSWLSWLNCIRNASRQQ